MRKLQNDQETIIEAKRYLKKYLTQSEYEFITLNLPLDQDYEFAISNFEVNYNDKIEETPSRISSSDFNLCESLLPFLYLAPFEDDLPCNFSKVSLICF